MPKPYSNDLRKRIVDSVNDGMKVEKAVKIYNVKKTAIYNWLDRYKKTGSYEAKSLKNVGRKSNLTETDLDNIRKKIKSEPDITLKELIKQLNLNVVQSTLCDIINKKLKLKYKKNSSCK